MAVRRVQMPTMKKDGPGEFEQAYLGVSYGQGTTANITLGSCGGLLQRRKAGMYGK
jgi:hypothetical protein